MHEVIKNYQIKDKLGYFMLDNATSNDTAMRDLKRRLRANNPFTKFTHQWRRLRCLGHIFNLVARQILFGNDKDIFEDESQVRIAKREGQERWRQFGAIGKLHNFVKWVSRLSCINQRCDIDAELYEVYRQFTI